MPADHPLYTSQSHPPKVNMMRLDEVSDRRQAGENRAGAVRTIEPLCLNTTPLPPHGQPQYLRIQIQFQIQIQLKMQIQM